MDLSLSINEVEILGHSLGINIAHAHNSDKKRDKKLPNEFYRNRFCASEYHSDLPILESLERMGYMVRGEKINNGNDTLWHVTESGIEKFRFSFASIIS